MTFNLLTKFGLRETHKVLDIGCGSLRNGRLLIQYLNAGNYVGIEPNGWLIDNAIQYEVGKEIIGMKKPTFIIADNLNGHKEQFDYIFAQSIFTHCDLEYIGGWFECIKRTLKADGHCFFTFFEGEKSNDYKGFNRRVLLRHPYIDIESLATKFDFHLQPLHHKHPYKQSWVLMVHK